MILSLKIHGLKRINFQFWKGGGFKRVIKWRDTIYCTIITTISRYSHTVLHVFFVISGVCYVGVCASFDWFPFRTDSHPRVCRDPTRAWGQGWGRHPYAASVPYPAAGRSRLSAPSLSPAQCQILATKIQSFL